MIDHERLLALIAKAGTIPLGHILTYQEQDELLTAVGPLIAESRAYLNDLRISNDVGHEWADRAQERAAALIKIRALAVSGSVPWGGNCYPCHKIETVVDEVLGA